MELYIFKKRVFAATDAALAFWRVVDNTENVTIFIRKNKKAAAIVHRKRLSFTFDTVTYTVAYMNPFSNQSVATKLTNLTTLAGHIDTVTALLPQATNSHIFMADVNITILPHKHSIDVQNKNKYPHNGRILLASLLNHGLYPKHAIANGHGNYLDVCMAPLSLHVETTAITNTGEQVFPARNTRDHTRVCYKVLKKYVSQKFV